MDSTVSKSSYATSKELAYGAHYAELVSDKVTFDNNKGKFILSYITPNLASSDAVDKSVPQSGGNIINGSGGGSVSVTTSNNVELEIPKHLFTIKEIKVTPSIEITPHITASATHAGESGGGNSCTPNVSCSPTAKCTPSVSIVYNEFVKGQKFIVVSIGGVINKPVIIGVA